MTEYTPEQLRKIDAQVAQVMGVACHDLYWVPNATGTVIEVFQPTRLIEHAWRCVDYMRERWNPSQVQTFQAEILKQVRAGRRFLPVAWLLHLTPLAICLAFLAANGVEVQV